MSELIIEHFNQWCAEHGVEPKHIIHEVELQEEQRRRDELTAHYESHRSIVGKCYYYHGRYYKVVSIRANNVYKVSCLVFNEHPCTSFHSMYQMGCVNAKYKGEMSLDCIGVEEHLISNLECWKKINEETYKRAYTNFWNELYDWDWDWRI